MSNLIKVDFNTGKQAIIIPRKVETPDIDRIQRLRLSLERINKLMVELRAEAESSNNKTER